MQSDVCVYVYTSTCVCVGKSVRKWMFVYTRYVCICICAVERKKSNGIASFPGSHAREREIEIVQAWRAWYFLSREKRKR